MEQQTEIINVNELRIGNILSINGNAYVFDLSDFHSLYENIKNYGALDLYPWEPIILTQDWMVKFGFMLCDESCTESKSQSDWYWVDSQLPFAIDNINWKLQKTKINIKYVHQLQNLYFTLTGKELKIKI